MNLELQRGYWNLVLERDTLKNILLSDRYAILSLPEIFKVKHKEDIKRLEDVALLVIKKYIDLFYRKNAKSFETENLRYEGFKQLPFPFISENRHGYIVQIDRREKELIMEIRNLTKDMKRLLKEDTETLPRVYFDGSLFVPILLQSKKIDKISPAGLVESEKRFVLELKDYLQTHKSKFSFEIYLLRNYPFSGVGFQLQWAGFYPDFIMWVKKGRQQTIIFIDPKGLEHAKGLEDEKIQFATREIKEIERKLGNNNIILESFILSKTSYNQLIDRMTPSPSKDEFIKHHVLFLEDKDWPEKLLCSSVLTANDHRF